MKLLCISTKTQGFIFIERCWLIYYVFAVYSEKKNIERKPIFNSNKFFSISLGWSCLYLLEIALYFHKNSRIYFWWEMLTNILLISYIFLEKKIALFKNTGKKKQFCLKMDVLSIFCFPLTFSILWSELWHAKTVTCYQDWWLSSK